MSEAGKTCINHPDRTAVNRCFSCHKPLCQECVVSTTEGAFCSRKCAEKTADFRAHHTSSKPKKNWVGLIVKIVIAVVVLGAIWKFRDKVPVLKSLFKKAVEQVERAAE